MPRKSGYGRKRIQVKGSKGAKSLTKVQKTQVKNIVKGQAETKMAVWYSGSTGSAGTGLTSQAQPMPQNQNIITNASDILRILPLVFQGVNDNERIGGAIRPVSCKLRCKVQLIPQAPNDYGYQFGYSYNIVAVAYCLQHVKYKTYDTLLAQNLFQQMLVTGENSTNSFSGRWEESDQPVHPGYYKLLAKKTMRLRSSGTESNATAGQNPNFEGTNMNSAPLTHEWTWDITKSLPKKLQYPEETPGFPASSPLNSAPFWCIGFYQDSGRPLATPLSQITQQYVTYLKYKDM